MQRHGFKAVLLCYELIAVDNSYFFSLAKDQKRKKMHKFAP